jgi:hypothetical protein
MAALTPQQIGHLAGLMDERWARESREIRSLLEGQDEARLRVS